MMLRLTLTSRTQHQHGSYTSARTRTFERVRCGSMHCTFVGVRHQAIGSYSKQRSGGCKATKHIPIFIRIFFESSIVWRNSRAPWEAVRCQSVKNENPPRPPPESLRDSTKNPIDVFFNGTEGRCMGALILQTLYALPTAVKLF